MNFAPGGQYALSLPVNPYYIAGTGKFRKPTQADLINEICAWEGVPSTNCVRIIDSPEVYRHICRVLPYSHGLLLKNYPVHMPDGSVISVNYYVHSPCGRLIIVTSSLSDKTVF